MFKPISPLVFSLALLGLPTAGQSNEATEVVLVVNRPYTASGPLPAADPGTQPPRAPLLAAETRHMQEVLARKIERQVQATLAGERR